MLCFYVESLRKMSKNRCTQHLLYTFGTNDFFHDLFVLYDNFLFSKSQCDVLQNIVFKLHAKCIRRFLRTYQTITDNYWYMYIIFSCINNSIKKKCKQIFVDFCKCFLVTYSRAGVKCTHTNILNRYH